MSDPSSAVLVERRGLAVWLRLNRPDRRNAYDETMLETMLEAIAGAPRDHFIVLTGTQGAFCAGGYLANLATADESEQPVPCVAVVRTRGAATEHRTPSGPTSASRTSSSSR